jgi:hypothetical protein
MQALRDECPSLALDVLAAFHGLEGDRVGIYVRQFGCTFSSPLDAITAPASARCWLRPTPQPFACATELRIDHVKIENEAWQRAELAKGGARPVRSAGR